VIYLVFGASFRFSLSRFLILMFGLRPFCKVDLHHKNYIDECPKFLERIIFARKSVRFSISIAVSYSHLPMPQIYSV